jgi:hypothetical protein
VANDVVNIVDTVWFAIYIPIVDFSFSLSRLRWIFLGDDDDDEHLFSYERKENKRKE